VKDYKLGKYLVVNDWEKAEQNSNSKHRSILPRMWSTEHAENYMMFTGFLDFSLNPNLQQDLFYSALSEGYSEEQAKMYASQMINQLTSSISEFKKDVAKGNIDYEDYHKFLMDFKDNLDIKKPSLISNIAYLLEYQLGYMYWRYFMWNFTGRQDDIQGKYDDHGNWISGIKFIGNKIPEHCNYSGCCLE